MIISVRCLLIRCLLGCLTALTRHRLSKDAELLVVRHEALVRREALGTEGGVSPPRQAVAAAW